MIYHPVYCSKLNSIPLQTFVDKKQELWAVAYDIDGNTLHANLKQLPVKGCIVKNGQYEFAPFNKRGEIRKTGHVHYKSRIYADTYEEAIDAYNQQVQKHIDLKKSHIQEIAKEFLDEHGEPKTQIINIPKYNIGTNIWADSKFFGILKYQIKEIHITEDCIQYTAHAISPAYGDYPAELVDSIDFTDDDIENHTVCLSLSNANAYLNDTLPKP